MDPIRPDQTKGLAALYYYAGYFHETPKNNAWAICSKHEMITSFIRGLRCVAAVALYVI